MSDSRASPSSSSSSGDGVSDTSTLVYSHEPFESYVDRVTDLVLALHPASERNDISVERMKGGGYNRIIGYSFKNVEDQQENFVLRIPRFDRAQMLHDLIPLLFLRDHSDLPVPQVVFYDTTNQNALDHPYMIQQRIPGGPLHESYPNLLHHEKLMVARRVGQAINYMTSVHGQKIGRLTAALVDINTQPDYMVEQLDDIGCDPPEPYISRPGTKSALQLLREIVNYRNNKCLEKVPVDETGSDIWQQYIATLTEMNEHGYFTNVDVTLCHMDFEPRNILFDTAATQTDVSAFLDWDGAIFAPSFMVCKPPAWIWAWQDDEEEDELTANDIPADSEKRELKAAFEEAAGSVYARFAYEPVYRLARTLVARILFGFKYNEDFYASQKMLREWAQLRNGTTDSAKD